MEAIHGHKPLEVFNVNMSFGHVFNHLYNCLITINLVFDLNRIPKIARDVMEKSP